MDDGTSTIFLPSFNQTISGSGKSVSINLAEKFTGDTCKTENSSEDGRRDFTGEAHICLASETGYASGGNLASATLQVDGDVKVKLPADEELGLTEVEITYTPQILTLKFEGDVNTPAWPTTVTVECDIEAKVPYVSKTSVKDNGSASMTIKAKDVCGLSEKAQNDLNSREQGADEYFSVIPSSGFSAVLSIATLVVSLLFCLF